MLLQEKFRNHRIILASQSPRRKELLKGLDLSFDVIPLNTAENYPRTLKRDEITEFLCHKKAQSFKAWEKDVILLTSDTIVWQNDQALEKPANQKNAVEMLRQLSGKTHEVISSVGIFSSGKHQIITDIAEVTFGELTNEEIEYYIEKYQPFDKAGSYGVQEWIGYMGVKAIKGSYFTVMGLPVYELYKALKVF